MSDKKEVILLSICIPTYNRASYLRSCLTECMKLTRTDIEIVVCDNASQDNTQEVIRSFNDRRISVFRNDNNIGANLNIIRVSKRASGKYILFLSDEDFIDTTGIESSMQYLQSGKYSVVFGSIFDRNTKKYYVHYKERQYHGFKSKIMNMSYNHAYFTAIILLKESLDLDFVEEYQVKNPDYVYPHEVMIIMCLKKGIGLTIPAIICQKGIEDKNTTIITEEKNIYYNPVARIRLIKHFISISESLRFDTRQLKCLYTRIGGMAAAIYFDKALRMFPKRETFRFLNAMLREKRIRLSFIRRIVYFGIKRNLSRVKQFIRRNGHTCAAPGNRENARNA